MKRANKFNAVKTVVDGITFHSKAEARRYGELVVLENAGKIQRLELQPQFKCVVNGKKILSYKADFRYFDTATGRTVTEDVKSPPTAKKRDFRITKKLVEALHPGTEIEVVK